MDATRQAELEAALELLWQRFLPTTRERVALLEDTAAACAAGHLQSAQVAAAHDAAHKLAGSLGTFNLTQGTVLARELELMYSVGDEPGLEQASQLTRLAAELRTLIEHR